jgi:hypothetical protein
MHVEWLDKDATLQIGGAIRMKTFWKKKEEKDMMADLYEGAAEADEEYFDDGYLEIERIVAEREVPAEDGVSSPQKQVRFSCATCIMLLRYPTVFYQMACRGSRRVHMGRCQRHQR